MSPGRHAASDASFVRSAGGAATRGIILIVVAVVIGVVLIATAVDDNNAVVTAASTTPAPVTTAPTSTDAPAVTTDTTEPPTATTADTAPATSAVEESTTTTSPGAVFEPRAPNIVNVQVVNTTKVGGAAGRATDSLKAQGYITLDPATDSGGLLTETKIHHQGGYLLEAQALAELLLLDPETSVFSMPSNPGASVDNYLEPHVLVRLGADIASSG